jgi:hypothetical protein
MSDHRGFKGMAISAGLLAKAASFAESLVTIAQLN